LRFQPEVSDNGGGEYFTRPARAGFV
jgi:hypothetical protein